jgi:hypothetical protein
MIYTDTVINQKRTKVGVMTASNDCAAIYGQYSFYENKSQKAIFINYYNQANKKMVSHKQYSLKLKDSTDCINMLSDQNSNYTITDGHAFYEKDTAILSCNNIIYNCRVFMEVPSKSIDDNSVLYRRIFIEKTSLLPIRFEYLNTKGEIKYYYLISKVNVPLSKLSYSRKNE